MNERERAIREISDTLHRLIYHGLTDQDGNRDNQLTYLAETAVSGAEWHREKWDAFRRAEMGEDVD